MKVCVTIFLAFCFNFSAIAKDSKAKLKYKSGKRIDFKSLLIEGEKKKADFSVVTGNLGEEDLGLLKIRKDFTAEMQDEGKEAIE